MNYQPISRRKQQLGGGILFLIGVAFDIWIWQMAMQEGRFYRKASLIFPAFAVIGIGLVLVPGYREERIAKGEDISKLSGLQLLTPRWWAILIVAIVASIANLVAIVMICT